jgi:hypothetical protein
MHVKAGAQSHRMINSVTGTDKGMRDNIPRKTPKWAGHIEAVKHTEKLQTRPCEAKGEIKYNKTRMSMNLGEEEVKLSEYDN